MLPYISYPPTHDIIELLFCKDTEIKYNNDMGNSTPKIIEVPQEVAINTSSFDQILNAKNKTELRKAVDDVLSVCRDKDEKLLNEIQSTLKNMRSNPEKTVLKKDFSTAIGNYDKKVTIRDAITVLTSVHSSDREHVVPLRNKLITEYEAHTPTQLLIIDQMVSAYFRSMRSSSVYHLLIQDSEDVVHFDTQVRINLIKELNKQVDIANKQFLLSATYFKEFNRRSLNIKLQSKQTFIAENQQFN